MTAQELNTYIDKVLGSSLRCLLPSYWWKRLLKLVVEYVERGIDAVSKNVDTKIIEVDNKVNSINNAFIKSALFRIKITARDSGDAIVVADGKEITIPAGKSKSIPFTYEFKAGNSRGGGNIAEIDTTIACTSFIEDMSQMFYLCPFVAGFDTSSFDTSNVKNMNFMFAANPFLEELDLTNFDTSKVSRMRGMFASCSGLKSLDVSSFDTSNVEYMDGIFENCVSLVTLTLGQNFFKMQSLETGVDFSSLENWSSESAIPSLVTNSYDRTANGLANLTLKLHANTYAYLTDEHKATMISKGYVIEVA